MNKSKKWVSRRCQAGCPKQGTGSQDRNRSSLWPRPPATNEQRQQQAFPYNAGNRCGIHRSRSEEADYGPGECELSSCCCCCCCISAIDAPRPGPSMTRQTPSGANQIPPSDLPAAPARAALLNLVVVVLCKLHTAEPSSKA
ncbi:hypothetical protein Aduo_012271 [Ancylostoma duodenale]